MQALSYLQAPLPSFEVKAHTSASDFIISGVVVQAYRVTFMVDGSLKRFEFFGDDQDNHEQQYSQPVPCMSPVKQTDMLLSKIYRLI